MTYNPFIPLPPDLPSDSQGDILLDFNLLNNFYGVDHVPFGNAIRNGTLASPIVITSLNHGLTTGDTVTIQTMQGTTPEGVIQPWPINGNTFTVTVINPNFFSLNGTNGTTYPPYIQNSGSFDSTDLDYGFHTKNFFPQAITADPNRDAPISGYYTKLNASNIPQLFFQNGSLAAMVSQLVNLPVANQTAAGQGFKTPWGMIINMGMVQANRQSVTTYNFPTPYTSRVFTLILTMKLSGSVTDPQINPVGLASSLTQFQVQLQSNLNANFSRSVFYIAIGQ